MARRFPALIATFCFAILSLTAQEADDVVAVSKSAKLSNNLYIVQMSDAPVVTYDGSIKGYSATKPRKGQKIDPYSSEVVAYSGYLQSKHSEALNHAGGRKVRDYAYTFNGFSAELTPSQASALATATGVVSVVKDELQQADTASTPQFIGISNPGGLWEKVGGVGRAGEDIIIGVVDSGIWPESASFSDRTGTNGNGTQNGKLDYQQIPGWHGKCTPGDQFTAADCNQKLIGAQYFNDGWGGDAGLKAARPHEFASARDYHGHGTHTASTAGGNNGVALPGVLSPFGRVSGIAPRARIAAYKALYQNPATGSANGFTSDLVAAIDQAVADGVDVINYSVSGTQTNFADPVEIAFLNATAAGIFVSTSAGNAGSTGSVAHPGPWLTTVAAGTHNRNGEGDVTINGVVYTGASYATPVSGQLVDSDNAGLPVPEGVAPAVWALRVQQCHSIATNGGKPVLDPAKVAGKIVVCDRGSNALVDKSAAVKEAGGIGMVLVNISTSGPPLAQVHSVPAVHLPFSSYTAVHAAADAGQSASIHLARIVFNVPAPATASFSSRGPLTAGNGDVLKPDVMAPGVDILAAVAPPGNAGQDFSSYQGTSMSAPHVAGLAALLKNLHPTWTPMMIKSALMTTGFDVLDAGTPPPAAALATLIFRQGAGFVKPNSAADPGLVFNSDVNDWLAFLCGATTAINPAACTSLKGAGYSTDRSDMNTASIAIGDLISAQQVTRRVTNVGSGSATYNATVTGLTGINAVVSPSSLTLAPGQTKSFTVTFTRTSAAFNSYSGGNLIWSDGLHQVRVPLVMRPLSLVAPAQVNGNGGPINYNVSFGFSGPFTAAPRGLVAATLTPGTVDDDPADSFSLTGKGVSKVGEFTLPAGTTYARFSLFDTDVTPASDIDLVLFRKNADGSLTQVAATGGATSNEEANLAFATPTTAAATYVVYAHGFNVPGTANFTLFSWILGTANAGNMSVSAPANAVLGSTAPITLNFTGLTSGTKYLGSIVYGGATGLPTTIVRVDQQ